MRKTFAIAMSVVLAILQLCSCNKNTKPEPVPIAPILMDIVMPSMAESMPGTDATIKGLGFDKSDIITFISQADYTAFEVKVIAVTDYSITIHIPSDAYGVYAVTVTRAGKTSMLDKQITVPGVLYFEDVYITEDVIMIGGSTTVKAKGIKTGDIFAFESDSYPEGVSYDIDAEITEGEATLSIPSGTVYGINTIKVRRGERVGTLGTIKIGVPLYTKIGGGIVFYTSDGGAHGLILSNYKKQSPFGPEVPKSYYAKTTPGIYTGRDNTEKLVQQYEDTKDLLSYDAETLTPAVMCHNYSETVDGITYNDWFLPSRDELAELYKVRGDLGMPAGFWEARPYWSSTEVAPGNKDENVRFMSNILFYKAWPDKDPVVDNNASKTSYKLSTTVAIRQF